MVDVIVGGGCSGLSLMRARAIDRAASVAAKVNLCDNSVTVLGLQRSTGGCSGVYASNHD